MNGYQQVGRRSSIMVAFSSVPGTQVRASEVALIRDSASLRLVVPPLVGHMSGVNGLWFTPDKRTLQTFASGETKLWSVATGQELVHRRLLQGWLLGLSPSFSPDGMLFWEEAGGGRRLKFTRLRTLAEIDAIERTSAAAAPIGN